MQNGIVYYPETTNIGDDIQTYAASLLVDNPVFCDRERLDEINQPTRLLCNGWFMHDGSHWPPSDNVNPLFISFHITSKTEKLMTSPSALAYYRKHQPIGCRDYHTLDIMRKHNVEAYFSGCLTLTLPKHEGPKSDEILFVNVLRTNYKDGYRNTVVNNMIPDKYRHKVKFVNHISDDLKQLDATTRMKQAKSFLERYAKAKLVFTSLIHCALPCVSMGTPVVFIDFGFNNNAAKRDRFKGITDLFHVESGLEAPFMHRDLIGKIGRGSGIYKLMPNSSYSKIPEDLFTYYEVTTNHLEIANKIKKEVSRVF